MAKDLKILENTRFVGEIPNDELPKYLRIADLYVSTALSDAGISASTAEAMACEIPVVITNTGENERWVENEKSGFLIPIKKPEIVAQKVVYLLENENKRKEIGRQARVKIVEENDYFREMSKMNSIHEEMIEEKL